MKTSIVLRLSFWVSFAFVLDAVVTTVAVFSTAAHIHLVEWAISGTGLPSSLTEMSDRRQSVVAAVQLGIGGVSSLLFFIWVYHANRNARLLGADDMKYSPTWSVVCFFIPFVNLIFPYWVMREIWQASSRNDAGAWRKTYVSPVLPIWWCIAILNSIVSFNPVPALLGLRNLTDADRFPNSLEWVLQYFQGLFIWYILSLASSILFCIVVITISGRQAR